MAPKLYIRTFSPPCRAVLMVAKAIGVELDLELIQSRDQLKTEEMLKLNPQHTIPFLVEADEDFILSDSHAIAGYLVGQYAEDDSMYPKEDVKKRALIDQRLHFDNGPLFERFGAASIPLLNGEEIPEDISDKLLEALGIMESLLNGRKWFVGDDVTIADLSLLATVVTIETMIFPVDPDRFSQLSEWLSRAKKLPYYEECNTAGLKILQEMISKK